MLRTLRRFVRRTDGATAIEAIFIIPLFFAMVFSTFEVGTVFYRTSMVELTATDMTRLVLTGRAPKPGAAGGTASCSAGRECFFDAVCERVSTFGNCDAKLSVEVQSFDTIQEVLDDTTLMTCPNQTGYDPALMDYDPGDRNTYTRVRICYLLDVINPALGLSLQDNTDGTKSVIAVQIRRNEPFLGNDDINPNETGP